MPISFRTACLTGFGVCLGLMAYALYAQHGLGLEPCPLCILQRMAVIVTGLVFLTAAVHGPGARTRWLYGVIAFITAAVGAAIAGRHVWLQSLPPDQVPACGPGYDYMMEAFPLMKALGMIFTGSGECAEVDWTFLGLSMPVWTLVSFVLLAVWALYATTRSRQAD